jgi:acyl-CoA hydrolase
VGERQVFRIGRQLDRRRRLIAVSISIWYADGHGGPRISPTAALTATGLRPDAECTVMMGWTVERPTWLEEPPNNPNTRVFTVLAGYGLARAANDGRVVTLPVRLSAVPSVIQNDPPDIAILSGIRRGNALAFSASVGWADVLARTAKSVIVEIDDDGVDLGGPEIVGNIVATLDRPKSDNDAPIVSRPADEVDLAIGAQVAALLPDEPTLQFGPGGIGEGIARALDRPVHLWSGLVTDSMALLDGKDLLLSPATAAYAWGGAPILSLHEAGMLRLISSTVTHDISRLTAIPRLVGCNTAVQLGLDGAVNVERVGGRVIAGIGGHADFCVGASRSVGGFAVIAVRSTTSAGTSTIVPNVDVVSTPRTDISFVVTEHGVADVRKVTEDERASRLIDLAAPEHRPGLAEAFQAAGR